MFQELLLSAEGTRSGTARKRVSKDGRKRATKSSKRFARKASPKRKPAPKRIKPSNRGAGKRGNPRAYPDKTVVRMPKGWLRELNTMAKTKKIGQGALMRRAVAWLLNKTL